MPPSVSSAAGPWASWSRTGPSSIWFDSAALHLGAIPFSIYNTYAPEQIGYQIKDAGARIVVTEKAFLDRLEALEGIDHVIVVDAGGTDEAMTIADVEAEGDPEFDFEAAWRAVAPEDVLTLIYTSGTTGPPKGSSSRTRTSWRRSTGSTR